jgi:hypothetical protein
LSKLVIFYNGMEEKENESIFRLLRLERHRKTAPLSIRCRALRGNG